MYQFLPLAHVLARVAQAVVLSVGARLIYWGGDTAKIVDELLDDGSDARAGRAADLREDAGRRHRRDLAQAGSAARAVRMGRAVRWSGPDSPT